MKRNIAIGMVWGMLAWSAAAADPVDEYATVLATYVDEAGRVDYANLAKNRGGLDAFAHSLAALDSVQYERWAPAEQLAFWLNAYNALTLQLIVDAYPIEPSDAGAGQPDNSIRQIDGAWDGLTFSVMGRRMTLDYIEHKIIRTYFRDPRVHMALVCAALSCPPLRAEPYRGDILSRQLDDQARSFVTNPSHVRLDREKGIVTVSSIFDWFAEDFDALEGGSGNGAIDFISRYIDDEDVKAWLTRSAYEIDTFPYDWTLNEQTE